MKVGDLVRLKQQGGIGIILEQKKVWSNIAMGNATKQLVRWIEPPSGRRSNLSDNLYFVAYLELIDPTDKN